MEPDRRKNGIADTARDQERGAAEEPAEPRFAMCRRFGIAAVDLRIVTAGLDDANFDVVWYQEVGRAAP
jgi:hypothetical protein